MMLPSFFQRAGAILIPTLLLGVSCATSSNPFLWNRISFEIESTPPDVLDQSWDFHVAVFPPTASFEFDLSVPSRTSEDAIAMMIAQAINARAAQPNLAAVTKVEAGPDFVDLKDGATLHVTAVVAEGTTKTHLTIFHQNNKSE